MKNLMHFFSRNRTAKNPYKRNFRAVLDFVENLGGIKKGSIIALIILALLILKLAADYYSIYVIFRGLQFNFDPLIQNILAIVFTVAFEVIPCLFGIALFKLRNTNITDQIERRKQKTVLIVSSVALVFMFTLVIFLRVIFA